MSDHLYTVFNLSSFSQVDFDICSDQTMEVIPKSTSFITGNLKMIGVIKWLELVSSGSKFIKGKLDGTST